jgi:hypothetical protein
MKLKHPILKSIKSVSSAGSYTIDEHGHTEVSPELGSHLVKCGFTVVPIPGEPPVKPPVDSAPLVTPVEAVIPPVVPVAHSESPVVKDEPTSPETPKAKEAAKKKHK